MAEESSVSSGHLASASASILQALAASIQMQSAVLEEWASTPQLASREEWASVALALKGAAMTAEEKAALESPLAVALHNTARTARKLYRSG